MEEKVEMVRKPRTIIIEVDTLGSLFRGLVFGGLVGAAIALLVTPQKGIENRAVLNQKSGEWMNKAQEVANEARSRAQRVVASARGMDVPHSNGGSTQQLQEENQIMEEKNRTTYDL